MWTSLCMEEDTLHWNREQEGNNDGRVEWEGIDEVFHFVFDTFKLLALCMEISSMQLGTDF